MLSLPAAETILAVEKPYKLAAREFAAVESRVPLAEGGPWRGPRVGKWRCRRRERIAPESRVSIHVRAHAGDSLLRRAPRRSCHAGPPR